MLLLKNWNRITAIAAKGRRYQGRVDSYRQNRLFEDNQRQFYRELYQEEETRDNDQPVAEESKQFWGNIWRQSADDEKEAKWLQDLRSEVNVKKREKIDITTGSLIKQFLQFAWKGKLAAKRMLRLWVCTYLVD